MNSRLIIKEVCNNEFTFFINHTSEEFNKTKISLFLKVGSFYERENQRGICHFLEHMNMSFDKIKMYPNFNYTGEAYTDFYSTEYSIYTTSKLEDIEKGLYILYQIVQGSYLNKYLLENIRCDVLKEFDKYMKSEQFIINNLILAGTKYDNKFAIGTENVIKKITYNQLETFHYKYYTPSAMCICLSTPYKDTDQLKHLIIKDFIKLRETSIICPLAREFDYKNEKFELHKIFKERNKMELWVNIPCAEHNLMSNVKEELAFQMVKNVTLRFLSKKNINLNNLNYLKVFIDKDMYFMNIKVMFDENLNENYIKNTGKQLLGYLSNYINYKIAFENCVAELNKQYSDYRNYFISEEVKLDLTNRFCFYNYIYDIPIPDEPDMCDYKSLIISLKFKDIISYLQNVYFRSNFIVFH